MNDENVLLKPVTVTVSAVSPKDVPLSKSRNESIVWRSEINGTVTFPVSPFIMGRVFELTEHGATPSGGIDPKAAEGEYPYTVVDENGKEIDPRVFIDR